MNKNAQEFPLFDLFSLWSLFRLHAIIAVISHLSKYFILLMLFHDILLFDGNMQYNFDFFCNWLHIAAFSLWMLQCFLLVQFLFAIDLTFHQFILL